MAANRIKGAGKKLTAKDIAAVEKHIGIELPKDLKDFYLRNNGGQPTRDWFGDSEGEEHHLHEFKTMHHRSKKDDWLFEDTYDTVVKQKKLVPKNLIPFAVNDSGDFYCMDRKTQAIYFFSMETDDKQLVGKSLQSWLDSMKTEEDFYSEEEEDE